ncbi:MAG: hypothetical protein OES32_02290 [Acidobacteriota bacterium]|nr:hypothetical protein [Acidobacteriota bacterium]MDH3522390.1 hypothetical protein [Acidobacteriota bacterium]
MRAIRAIATLLALAALAAGTSAADPVTFGIQYMTADRVYLHGGSRFGLAVGDRLEVERDGEQIGVLEVVFVATHSASCRVLEATEALRTGDVAIWDSPRTPVAMPAAATTVTAARQDPAPPAPSYSRTEPERRPELKANVSGSMTFDWEQFTDESGYDRDFDRTSARLGLRGRDLGGMPLQLRIRASTRTLDRVVSSDDSSTISETRDRLYELSLAYEPPEGRFALRLGRLRLGRYAGAGTVDGVSAETRVGRVFHVGVFGGARSDISDFGPDSDRTTYGLTTRWTTGEPQRLREILLAAVREDGIEDVSREYVAVQSRLTGGRLSFYARGELDLNNGWRQELTGTSSQLSTLFVNASARISERNRFSLSYSRFERYRTEETRFIPEELFDTGQRQGFQARWQTGRANGLNVALSAGWRQRENDEKDTTSAGLGVHHNNLFGRGYSFGVNVLAYSNPYSDGTTGTLRVGKRLRGGHRLGLTAGARLLDDALRGGESRETQWFRLDGWFELPGQLFARAEAEVSSGDDLEGQRFLLGLGYRF